MRSTTGISEHWWNSKAPHEDIWKILNRLEDTIEERNNRFRRWFGRYMNRSVHGFDPGDRVDEKEKLKRKQGEEPRLVLNPVENCLSTLGARIAGQHPRARFLVNSNGEDGHILKRKAEAREKFVAGEWYRRKVYKLAVKMFIHAGIVGFGAMKVCDDGDHLSFEVTPPWEIIVDEAAAMAAEPRSLYQVGYWPAEVLIAMYPDRKSRAMIEEAIGKAWQSRPGDGTKLVTDLVQTVEAWHLPSSSSAKDGRHVICIEGHTLTPKDEQAWHYDRFPFVFFQWETPALGWYPIGLVERQEPVQMQMNKMLARIQDALHLYAVTTTYYEKGSVNKDHFKNISGKQIPYAKGSSPPKTEMPPSISSEVYRFVWDLASQIFQGSGVSQLTAQGVKPPGVEAAVALRELKDTEGGRHRLLNQEWDRVWTDLADLTVLMAAALAKRNRGYKTNYLHADRIEEIDFIKDADLDRDCYELQVFPSSQLPHEPAGRLATVEELMEMGLVESKEQAAALLDFPDLEQYMSLETSGIQHLEWQIWRMLDEGEYEPPEHHQPGLIHGIQMVTAAHLRAKRQNVPEERRRLLLDWLTQAIEIVEAERVASQPQPQPQPPQIQQ